MCTFVKLAINLQVNFNSLRISGLRPRQSRPHQTWIQDGVSTLNWCEARPSFERECSSNAPDVANFLSGYFVSLMYSFWGCQTKPREIYKFRSKFQGQTKCKLCTTANFKAKFSVTYAGFYFHIFAYESSLFYIGRR